MDMLQMLLAEREIARALAGFARAMDERNWPGLADIMIADATADMGTGPVEGRDAVVAIMRSFLDECGPTQHLLGNIVIDVDGHEAASRCYVSDMHLGVADKTGKTFSTIGEYHDRWRRIDGKWWMVHRKKLSRALIGEIGVLGSGPSGWR